MSAQKHIKFQLQRKLHHVLALYVLFIKPQDVLPHYLLLLSPLLLLYLLGFWDMHSLLPSLTLMTQCSYNKSYVFPILSLPFYKYCLLFLSLCLFKYHFCSAITLGLDCFQSLFLLFYKITMVTEEVKNDERYLTVHH